jgi:hypothetical protein
MYSRRVSFVVYVRKRTALLTGLFLAAALPLTVLKGCQPRTPEKSSAFSPTEPPSSESDLKRLRQSEAFRGVETSFRQKDYTGAVAQIDTLLAEPNRPPIKQDFLRRQRAICEAAAAPPLIPKKDSKQLPVLPVKDALPVASSADCGPRALFLACQQLNIGTTLEHLTKTAQTTAKGTTLDGLKKAAQSVGLTAEGKQMDVNALSHLQTPAVAWFDGKHFVTISAIRGNSVMVRDPNQTETETISLEKLLRRSGGIVLTLRKGEP